MDIKQSLEELRRQEQQQIAKIQDAVTSLSTLLSRQSEALLALYEQVEGQKRVQETLHQEVSRAQESGEKNYQAIHGMLLRLHQGMEELRSSVADQHLLQAENHRCREQIAQREQQLAELEGALAAAQKEAAEAASLPQEYMTLYQSYQAYRTWNETREAAGQPRVFPQIPSDHFLAYLKGCIPDAAISQIFKYAERIVWDPQKKEELARLDRLIDSCILVQFLANRRRLRRQEVRPGDTFDAMFHCKQTQAPAVSRVTRVLLRGVEGDTGALLNDCRTFVEVQ